MVCYDNIPEEMKRLNQWVCAIEESKVMSGEYAVYKGIKLREVV